MAGNKNGSTTINDESYAKPGKVRFSQVDVDPSVQREVVTIQVNAIVGDFDPNALGFISVSVRDNGQMILLDGLQRKTACTIVGYDEPVDVILHYNLTKAQEAALFRRLNKRTNVSSIAGYKVAITEGVPEALAVDAVLQENKINAGSAGAGFQAVGRALKIVAQPDGINDLRFAFAVATYCWQSGSVVQRLDGVIIEALAMIHHRDGATGLLNPKDLMERLASRKNGQPGILGEARTRQSIRGGRLPVAVIDVIIDAYNLRRSKNKLPEWQR